MPPSLTRHSHSTIGIVTMHLHVFRLLIALAAPALLLLSPATFAATGEINLTASGVGYFALGLFFVAYLLVMGEEMLHLRKSKPVLVAAGLIWMLIGWEYTQGGMSHAAEAAFRHTLLEFAELMLFLLVAMTYINAMEERRVFDGLRAWMIRKGFNYRTLLDRKSVV